MRLYSFARPTGHTIDRFHLAAGEFVGRHEPVVGHLFCVVARQGWVPARDVAEVAIAASVAGRVREAGEMHSAGSASGLTAVVLEGNAFRVQARANRETSL